MKIMKKILLYTLIASVIISCDDFEDENLDFSNSLPQYVEITSSDFEGSEGDEVTVTVSLGEALPDDVTVGYSVTGDITQSGSIVIPANSQSASATITIADNETLEATGGSATFALTSVDNGLDLGRGGPDAGFSKLEATIDWEEDLKEIGLSVDTIEVAEMSGQMLFIVTAGNDVDADISVNYSITGDLTAGVDYTVGANPIIIEAGTTQDTIVVTFADAFDNATADADRNFYIELTSISGGNAETSLLADQSLGRVFVDDSTVVSFSTASTSVSGSSVIAIPVSLSNLDFDNGNTNDVTYTITGGTAGVDYNDVSGGSISFALDQEEEILIEVLDAGTDVDLTVTLTGSNDPETEIGTASSHTVEIRNAP